MQIPVRLRNYLAESGVDYQVLHHPVAYTAQELASIEGVRGHEHAKVVMVRAGQRVVMAVLPADRRVDLVKLGQVLGAEAALAQEADFKDLFPDCETGTMPPFGHLYGVEMWLDESFTGNIWIAFEAGTHSDAVRMSFSDYARIAKVNFADFSYKLMSTNPKQPPVIPVDRLGPKP